MSETDKFPSNGELMLYILKAMKKLGGTASVKDINDTVIRENRLTGDVFVQKLKPSGSQTQLDLRLAWGRSHLKKLDYIKVLERGHWALVNHDLDVGVLNASMLAQAIFSSLARDKASKPKLPKAPKAAKALHALKTRGHKPTSMATQELRIVADHNDVGRVQSLPDGTGNTYVFNTPGTYDINIK